jgi:uncharacterized protein (DUF1015 family)
MRVAPFRGFRYAIGKVHDLSHVVAPPYDQITPAMQERLYAMSPDNIVRVSYPKGQTDARYADARAVLEQWEAAGVWSQEEWPAIYPYQQTYTTDGREVTRAGFIALGEVTDYARGEVLPHERTHAGPKEERRRLLDATGADIGLLFMLTDDPDGALLDISMPDGEPLAEARDLKGERHRLWRVTDETTIDRVKRAMAGAQVIIADGHHRYETAVAYARDHPYAAYKMMAFFSQRAPGLTIFANHRLVHDVPGFSWNRFVEAAATWFDVSPLTDPLAFRPMNRSLAAVAGGDAAVLSLRASAQSTIPWPPGTSAAWRRLAVSVLHEGLLRPLLGLTDDKLDARTNVDYTADQAEAVALARSGRYQAAFLIAPTTVGELEAVVRAGEVLPQKSTHFYPKLLDGLVFHKVGADA